MIRKIFLTFFFVQLITYVTTIVGNIIDGMVTGSFLGTNALAAYGLVTPFLTIITAIKKKRNYRQTIAAQYEKELPEFSLRLQAKAGLTGLAQVYGKYNTTPYDKLQMDLMYIANPGFLEDLRIIFATIKILFIKESTQGVAEGQVTAVQEDREKSA